jgi:hypothetical protein
MCINIPTDIALTRIKAYLRRDGKNFGLSSTRMEARCDIEALHLLDSGERDDAINRS